MKLRQVNHSPEGIPGSYVIEAMVVIFDAFKV